MFYERRSARASHVRRRRRHTYVYTHGGLTCVGYSYTDRIARHGGGQTCVGCYYTDRITLVASC
eukprot:3098771-Pyramimonas_sp.AAC.1